MNDEIDFGAAAWFLRTQCSTSIQDSLKKSGDQGFQQYMGCVNTPVMPERLAYYKSALNALEKA